MRVLLSSQCSTPTFQLFLGCFLCSSSKQTSSSHTCRYETTTAVTSLVHQSLCVNSGHGSLWYLPRVCPGKKASNVTFLLSLCDVSALTMFSTENISTNLGSGACWPSALCCKSQHVIEALSRILLLYTFFKSVPEFLVENNNGRIHQRACRSQICDHKYDSVDHMTHKSLLMFHWKLLIWSICSKSSGAKAGL